MAKFQLPFVKDQGLKRKVMDALPYAQVGGAYEGSFTRSMFDDQFFTALNYVVPAGQQLKILFFRVCTSEAGGARFQVFQTNPAAGLPGAPVVGSVPAGTRDYPMLEAPGSEVLRGGLRDPVYVLEGSIDFRILAQYPGSPDQAHAGPATGERYNIAWAGVIQIPE